MRWHGSRAAAARLALSNHPTADLPEHVIVAGAPDEEITRAGHGPELKRAIGRGLAAAVLCLDRCGSSGEQTKTTVAPATGLPEPSSVTLPRIKTPRGKARSRDCSTAPLGHSRRLATMR